MALYPNPSSLAREEDRAKQEERRELAKQLLVARYPNCSGVSHQSVARDVLLMADALLTELAK